MYDLMPFWCCFQNILIQRSSRVVIETDQTCFRKVQIFPLNLTNCFSLTNCEAPEQRELWRSRNESKTRRKAPTSQRHVLSWNNISYDVRSKTDPAGSDKVTLCYLNNTMWDERTYRLLLFADALFNAGRLHHDARQTLLQEENSTDVQLMTFYIKLKICKSALSGCRADFKMLSASCSVSFQSSSTWRSENKYKLVGFSKPGHYAVWECWLSAARELHSKTETACRENS